MPNLSWTEPESAANTDYQPIYPYNNVTQTEAGHKFELDDTPTRERIRLEHRSGTFTEMHPNGDVVHRIVGKDFEIIASDKNVLIKGVCNITVQGDSVFHVQGDSYQQVDGTVYQQVGGNVNQLIKGNCEQTVQGNYDMNVSGDINMSATNVNVNADLNVRGDISSTQTIAAVGNITAGMSVSANKSVETAGYMVAALTIDAGVSMYAPIVSDLFGSMEMFRLKVDQHVHIGNKGFPTSPPTQPMEI
jgi:hypothetical protein